MPNALSNLMQDNGWKDAFLRVTGQTPESMGINDEATAQQMALRIQQARSMSIGGMGASQGNFGNVGTRNESIYPTR